MATQKFVDVLLLCLFVYIRINGGHSQALEDGANGHVEGPTSIPDTGLGAGSDPGVGHEGAAPPAPPKPAPVPKECIDIYENAAMCKQWADGGECVKNAAFMLVQCAKSCKQCEGLPADQHGNDVGLTNGAGTSSIKATSKADDVISTGGAALGTEVVENPEKAQPDLNNTKLGTEQDESVPLTADKAETNPSNEGVPNDNNENVDKAPTIINLDGDDTEKPTSITGEHSQLLPGTDINRGELPTGGVEEAKSPNVDSMPTVMGPPVVGPSVSADAGSQTGVNTPGLQTQLPGSELGSVPVPGLTGAVDPNPPVAVPDNKTTGHSPEATGVIVDHKDEVVEQPVEHTEDVETEVDTEVEREETEVGNMDDTAVNNPEDAEVVVVQPDENTEDGETRVDPGVVIEEDDKEPMDDQAVKDESEDDYDSEDTEEDDEYDEEEYDDNTQDKLAPKENKAEKKQDTAEGAEEDTKPDSLGSVSSNEAVGPDVEEPGSGHFMAYFITCIVLVVLGYLFYHNRKKVMGYIVEGRNGKSDRRGNNGYKPLSVEVDDVPNLDNKSASKDFIY